MVLVEKHDQVVVVTLNRPQARNALSLAVTHALWDAVAAAGDDSDVAAVVLTGADPAFCAGVDLKEVTGEVPPSASRREPGTGPERDANGLYRFLPVIDKPIIGAINGVAVTGGLELALQLLPFAQHVAADVVSNDQDSVGRLMQHYRQIANAATLDEAHLLEGYMAETWRPGTSEVGARRADVTARGRRLTS